MTNTEKWFFVLLSKAIRNETINEYESDIDWAKIFELAVAHDVYSLLYSEIKKTHALLLDNILDKWGKASLVSTYSQEVMFFNINEALRLLNEAEIDVIAVKGLNFRFLYPNPSERSMADADILIHPEDFQATINVLNKAGFTFDSFNENVTSFKKKPFCNIEVHSNLIFEHEFKYANTFIKPWSNAVYDNGITTYAKVLSIEDCFIYTIVHMGKHLSYRGHGVRQLCDLILLIEKNMDRIDWDNIIKRLNQIELKNLTDIIFSICNKYFDMTVPAIWLYDNPDVERIGDVLIEHLLKCGVFGNRKGKNTKVFELRQTNKQLTIKSNFLSLISYLLKQFFPPYIAMKGTYKYLNKFPFMLPVAWISRTGRFLKNRSKYDKQIKEIISSTNVIDEETRLLKALQLEDIFMGQNF